MSLELWLALKDAYEQIEGDERMRGIILSSGLTKHVFTAGNDINELNLATTSEARFKRFWGVMMQFAARMYASRLVTIAAVRGACPAAGCAMAMCCDYRVMSEGKGSYIGLNEVALGVPVPKYLCELYKNAVGTATAESYLQKAQYFSAAEAKRCGLVHEVVPSAQVVPAAEREMRARLKFADAARVATKMNLRADFAERWSTHIREVEVNEYWRIASSPHVSKAIAFYLAMLKKKASAKAKRAKL